MPIGAILAAAAPWVLGGLAAGGTALTNRANSRAAREQMSFQERMSSSAAQRSVRDYELARLNPALAYERSASTPGGAAATLGDPVSAGISSAQGARQLAQAMKIAKQQSEADLQLKREQAQAAGAANKQATTQAQVNVDQSNLLRQQHAFNQTVQPHTRRQMAAEAQLRELMLPGARNTAAFENTINTSPLRSAKTLAEILKALGGR